MKLQHLRDFGDTLGRLIYGPQRFPKIQKPKKNRRLAVVTGANRGIGNAVVRGLLELFDGDIILTARDKKKGLAAVREMRAEGIKHPPLMHTLDITNKKSIENFTTFIKEHYGGLEILVNNASLFYPVFDESVEFAVQARTTIDTNFFGTLDLCHALFPLLRKNARVVNMSSLACINCLELMHPNIHQRIIDPLIDMEQLCEIMDEYVIAAQVGVVNTGYVMSPMGAYGMSKVGVTVMTAIQQRAFDLMDNNRLEEGKEAMDIVVNAVSPGYVVTDSNQSRGERSADEGALDTLRLCLLPPNVVEPRGHFLRYNKIYSMSELSINNVAQSDKMRSMPRFEALELDIKKTADHQDLEEETTFDKVRNLSRRVPLINRHHDYIYTTAKQVGSQDKKKKTTNKKKRDSGKIMEDQKKVKITKQTSKDKFDFIALIKHVWGGARKETLHSSNGGKCNGTDSLKEQSAKKKLEVKWTLFDIIKQMWINPKKK